jgi:hypothetical protein
MLAALEQMQMPRTFLLDTFFKATETSQTEYVDIDIVKGKRKLAPFVNPLHEGKLIERMGYTTQTFKPPYIKMKKATTAQNYLNRASGESIYGGMSPQQRLAQQLGRDLIELTDMITRREEWMAAQALTTGKITVKGDGVDAEIDFLMANDHKITLSSNDLWSDYTQSDPIANLREWKEKVGKDSGLVPELAIFGTQVLKHFLKNTQVTNLLDKTKVSLGQIVVSQLANGATYYGNIEGLDIYTYNEYYLDDNGDLQPMVPEDMIIMGSTRARAVRHYAAIQDLQAVLASVRYFPKSWEVEDPSVRWLMVQSAPLVCPHQIDAFINIKPLG